ncbi:MAG: MarR family transcriptional regulator [Alcaligenaceae bacterium]|nr:MarR family transcriptional regulator [Alcaligenaceae bacterium]
MQNQNDLETRATESDNQELKLWLRLLTCSNLIENRIRSYLRIEFETTLPRFDLMAQLAQEPKGMKMGDLSERLMVSNGNITAITSQLEKEDLIVRIVNKDDRRSTFIKLTPKGKRQYTKMAKAQGKWLEQMFDGLSPTSSRSLYKSLADLKKRILLNDEQ